MSTTIKTKRGEDIYLFCAPTDYDTKLPLLGMAIGEESVWLDAYDRKRLIEYLLAWGNHGLG